MSEKILIGIIILCFLLITVMWIRIRSSDRKIDRITNINLQLRDDIEKYGERLRISGLRIKELIDERNKAKATVEEISNINKDLIQQNRAAESIINNITKRYKTNEGGFTESREIINRAKELIEETKNIITTGNSRR